MGAGGVVSLAGAGIGIGTDEGGHGTVVVSGAGAEIIAEGTKGSSDGIGVGQGGQGSMTITAGGMVATDNGNGLDIGGAHGLPVADGIGTVAVQGDGTLDVTGTAFVWSGSTLVVDSSSAADIGTSGSFDAGNILIESGHTLVGNGLVSAGGLVNDGVIVASNSVASGQPSPGTLEIIGSVTGAGAIDIDQSGLLKFDNSVASSQTINFATGGAEMILSNPPGTFTAAIDNLSVGDKIEFGGGVVVMSATVTSPGTVTVTTNTGSIVLSDVSFAAGSSQSFTQFLDTATGDYAIQVLPSSFLNWTGAISTDLGAAGNWSPLGPPNSSDVIGFSNGGDTLTGSAHALGFDISGSGTFDFNGATLTVAGQPNPPYLPYAGGFGADTILNGATFNALGTSNISASGGATVTAEGGSSVSTLGDTVGSGGETGSLVLTGAGTNWTEEEDPSLDLNGYATGYLVVGENSGSVGFLSVSNGATLTTAGTIASESGADLANSAGAQGYATISSGGSWNATGLDVGNRGVGTLTVDSGTVTTSGNFIVANLDSSSGTVTVDAGGTIKSGATFNAVGNNAGSDGTMAIEAGGTFESTLPQQSTDYILNIGNDGPSGTLGPSSGYVLVDGGALSLNRNPLALGLNGGSGTLTVQSSGSVTVGSANSNTGDAALSVGKHGSDTITVTGSDSRLTADGFTYFGRGGNATLSVDNDAIVQIGTDPTGVGGLSIGDGTTSSGQPAGGSGTATVNDGGSLSSAQYINVGGRGVTGTLNINGGSVEAGTSMSVGNGNTVYGPGAGTVSIGAGGTLQIEGYGITAGDALALSTYVGSTADVTVNGAGALLSVAGTMAIGVASTAELTIGSGAVANASAAIVDASGTLTMSGGTLDPATTLTNAGIIAGFGTLDGALTNDSNVTANSGKLAVSGPISGSGNVTIDASSTFDAAATVAASQSVTFGEADATLILGTPGSGFSNAIDNLHDLDRIELAGITISGAVFSEGSITVSGSETYIFNDVTFATGASTDLLTGFDSTTGNDYIQVACYLQGTSILTDRGEVPVESLAIGDNVITRSGRPKPIKWIGRRSYDGAFAAGNPTLAPVLIRAGALADGIPRRDLYVSPEHAMYIGGVLVPARHLVNGTSILAARDIDPICYFHIELAAHDVLYAEGAAAETFIDCDSRGMFHNAAEYARLYPKEPSPGSLRESTSPASGRGARWHFCAKVIERGRKLAAINKRLAARAASLGLGNTNNGPLDGYIDYAEHAGIGGWTWCRTQPDTPIRLEILANDKVIGTVLADRFRADLKDAGLGDGRHGFELRYTRALDPFLRHTITVRRAVDHAPLLVEPLVVEPAKRLDEPAREAVAALLRHATTRAESIVEAEALHHLLLAEARQAQLARLRLLRRQGPVQQRRGSAPTAARRALIIDESWPRIDHDAGSQAIVSHMEALRRRRWHVSFTATAPLCDNTIAKATLESLGVTCHAAPEVGSVEELLRDMADQFQLVYLHRLSVASAYAGLVRRYQPAARLIYSVADLHHLRLARQAAVEARPELTRRAAMLRRQELLAMQQADAVITHSPVEAALLAREAPGAQVQVVPWAVRPGSAPRPWESRHGIMLVANFAHEPNADGLLWFVREVMPLVWSNAPDVTLTAAGAGLASGIARALADHRLKLLGHVPDLRPLLASARLAVAPLRYGAGIKGKVLEAWAAGLPCAMTPIAAEGLPLDTALAGSVAADAQSLARLILALHIDPAHNAALARAGRAVLRRYFSQKQLDAALAAALARPSATVHALRGAA